MHNLVLPPTGWGFMLIHDWREQGAMAVTDGGSLSFHRKNSSCYKATLQNIRGLLIQDWKPRGEWAWILSHIDSDHYSITLGLVKAGLWQKPKLIILPGLYSDQACREVLADYHKLALLLAATLKIPWPRRSDLINIIKNVKRVGVEQGSRLVAKELTYHIIWPPPPSKVGSRCKTLLNRLREKLESARRSCIKKQREEVCEKAMKIGEQEAEGIIEVLAPESYVKTVNLDEVLSIGNKPDFHLSSEQSCNRIEQSTYEYIYYQAFEKQRDPELFHLGSIINDFSIAYALECNHNKLSNCYTNIKIGTTEIHHLSMCYGYQLSLNKNIPLVYLADLQDELATAINYYKQYNRVPLINIGVEVAAHHGNSYSPALQSITPSILFFPRCNKHVPHSYKKNFKYRRRYADPALHTRITRIYSGHNCGLEMKIS